MKARLDNLRCVDMRQSNERGFLDAHLEQSFKNVPNDYARRPKPADYPLSFCGHSFKYVPNE